MSRFLVIGGGINGLCAAKALVESGCKNVAIIDAHPTGHSFGSSHGTTRITRSTYEDVAYVQLLQIIHREYWPRYSEELGADLIIPSAGVFWGRGARWKQYVQAVAAGTDLVDCLEPEQATRRSSFFHFRSASDVLWDRSAGVIAAKTVMEGLDRWLASRAVPRIAGNVTAVIPKPVGVVVKTGNEELLADRAVITAGGWLGKLIPAYAPTVRTIRQTVGYFGLDLPSRNQQPGEFPVWAYVGETANEFFYGLPAFGRPGVKIGRHVTSAPKNDDPDESTADHGLVKADLEKFIHEQFRVGIRQCFGFEDCLYTATTNEDFILDFSPEDKRIIIGSACSGHGFKFGPWTGRVLADLALMGGSSQPGLAAFGERFRWSQHEKWQTG